MKYISADGSGLPFDLQRNFGDALIRLGLVKEYSPPPPPRPDLNTTWNASRLLDGLPYISACCPHCKACYAESHRDIAKFSPFIHCATQELPPLDKLRCFAEMIEDWKPQPVVRKRESIHVPEM